MLFFTLIECTLGCFCGDGDDEFKGEVEVINRLLGELTLLPLSPTVLFSAS